MALLFMDGFDAGDSMQKWRNSGSGNATTTSTRFGIGRALNITTNAVYCDFTAASSVFFGVAVGSTNITNYPIMAFFTDSGASLQINVYLQSSGISVYRGATLLASYSKIILSNTYHYIEAKAMIDPSAGSVIVRYDGAVVINFSGNTKNTGTSNSIDSVMLNSYNAGALYDDFYLCDTSGSAPYNNFLGEIRVSTQVPNGAGSSTQFTPSSGANYTTVDELPYSATDYVQSGTSGNRDTYALSDISNAGTIYGVQNNIIAKKTDAAAISIKSALKSGSTVYYGSNTTLTTSDTVTRDIRTQDPNTSSAWTQSGINALEAGFEVV